MTKYIVEYHISTDDGQTHRKWWPSVDYHLILDDLLKFMKGGRRKTFIFGPPFIFTLCAYLEANINDWLIQDQLEKHGVINYRKMVNGYLRIPFEEKLRIVVAVLTDNAFQLREESTIVKNIDRLIETRNRLVHPRALFYIEESKFKVKPRRQKAKDHPLHTLTLRDCRTFYRAVRAFDRKFFDQYDRGYIKENNIIKEIKRTIHQTT